MRLRHGKEPMSKSLDDFRICLWTGKMQPHSVYRWLVDHPPVHYCQPPVVSGMQAKMRLAWMVYTRLRNLAGLPKSAPYPQGIDLLHTCQALASSDGPWVMDMADHFLGLGYTRRYGHMNNPSFIERVKKSLLDPSCCAVMPMNRTISQSLLERIPEAAGKVEVVEPALPAERAEPRELDSSRPLRLLFVGNHYWMKGGELALASWELLCREVPVELTIVCSSLPDDVRARYADEKSIRLLPEATGGMGRLGERLGLPYRQGMAGEHIRELFEWADIFFLPEWMDSLAVYLEAKAHGLPVVASRAAYAAELVGHGETGALVPIPYTVMGNGAGSQWNSVEDFVKLIRTVDVEPLARSFADAIAAYWHDPERYRMHSAAALAEVATGRFSLEQRNRKLRKIYSRAIG